MKAHVILMGRKYGSWNVDRKRFDWPEGLPAFPNLQGTVISKESVVLTVEAMAVKLGENLTNDDGSRRFTGHFFRVLGAQHMAAKGIQIAVIQLMARWQGDVVLRYVQESPLAIITQDYKVGCAEENLRTLITGLKAKSQASIQKFMELKIPNIADIKDEINDLGRRIDSVENPGYVCNGTITTGKVHLPKLEGISFPARDWRCKCGFKHGLTQVIRVKELPDDWKRICSKCFPKEVEELKPATSQEDESQDSTSSSSDDDPPEYQPPLQYPCVQCREVEGQGRCLRCGAWLCMQCALWPRHRQYCLPDPAASGSSASGSHQGMTDEYAFRVSNGQVLDSVSSTYGT